MSVSDGVALAASLAVVVLAWWPVRLALAHRAERAFERSHPVGKSGVIPGAEPIVLRGTRAGAVLLLHGYNDSPQAVSSLASALHDAGWTVYAPLLPGHGRTLQAFAASGADAWLGAARTAYAELKSRHEAVAVCGLSMGGALATIVAAEHPEARALVGIAPYLHVPAMMRALLVFGPVAAVGARYLRGGGGRSIHDPDAAARIIAYRASTPRLARELARVAHLAATTLPRVRQPTLFIQSREDNRIPSRATEQAFAAVGASDKSLLWVEGAGHVITVDYGHERVERDVVQWLSNRLP
jgi:carboxylesterase